MQLPTSEEQRRQLMNEFRRARRPQRVVLMLKNNANNNGNLSPQNIAALVAGSGGGAGGGGMKSASVVSLIPARLCVDAVALDFVSICASPPVEGGGLRSIDARLEPLLLPTNGVEHSAHILSTFEKKVTQKSCNCISVVWLQALL